MRFCSEKCREQFGTKMVAPKICKKYIGRAKKCPCCRTTKEYLDFVVIHQRRSRDTVRTGHYVRRLCGECQDTPEGMRYFAEKRNAAQAAARRMQHTMEKKRSMQSVDCPWIDGTIQWHPKPDRCEPDFPAQYMAGACYPSGKHKGS
jgi:hypothetical protein